MAILLGAGAETYLTQVRHFPVAGADGGLEIHSPQNTGRSGIVPVVGMRTLFVRIVAHNAFVYFLLLLGLISWGIPSVLATVNNAWSLGWVIASTLAKGVSPSTVAILILPHGILEIAGFSLGAAVGLQGLHFGMLALRGELKLTPHSVRVLVLCSVVGMLFLVAAALIESSITRELVLRYRAPSVP
jgi:uncharacterized membrane protein SpoIIM required for sporulation